MCTISLVPHPDSPNGFILTSNRDEAVSRKALPPSFEKYDQKKLYFPKDEQSGGTWVGVSELQRCVCLMNGAEKPHERKASYRKSRGIVVKDFLAAERLKTVISEYDLVAIEPFTMILVDWKNGLLFYELIWDGTEKKISKLALKDHIWSSSPLYNMEMKRNRENWFEELKKTKGFSAKTLLDFHHYGGEGNKYSDLIIDRGFLKTQSITQIWNSSDGIRFWYKDLENNKISVESFQFKA